MMYKYNIHDKIKIQTHLPLELNYFRTDNLTRPFDLNIQIVENIPVNLSQLNKVSSTYFGEENKQFIIRIIRKNPLKSEILLKDLRGETLLAMTRWYYLTRYMVDFSPILLGSSLIQQILRIKLLLKGLALLHCACISEKNSESGILLSAYPDVGKTTTTLLAVRTGLFEYLSDDEIIVDQNNVAWAFPKVLNIRNLEYVGFHERIGFLKKFGSVLLSLIPWPFNLYFARIEHVNVGDFFPIRKSVPIRYILILEHGKETYEHLSQEHCMKKIWLNNHRQYGYIPEILNMYSYLNDNFDIRELFLKEYDLLSAIVNKSECFVIRARTPHQFVKMLMRVLK